MTTSDSPRLQLLLLRSLGSLMQVARLACLIWLVTFGDAVVVYVDFPPIPWLRKTIHAIYREFTSQGLLNLAFIPVYIIALPSPACETSFRCCRFYSSFQF